MRAFDEAIAADSIDLDRRVRLAELFLEKYNGTDALATLTEVLAINPRHARANLAMAQLRLFDELESPSPLAAEEPRRESGAARSARPRRDPADRPRTVRGSGRGGAPRPDRRFHRAGGAHCAWPRRNTSSTTPPDSARRWPRSTRGSPGPPTPRPRWRTSPRGAGCTVKPCGSRRRGADRDPKSARALSYPRHQCAAHRGDRTRARGARPVVQARPVRSRGPRTRSTCSTRSRTTPRFARRGSSS